MAVDEPISYDRAELRSILKAFKALDDEAVDEANLQAMRWLNLPQTESNKQPMADSFQLKPLGGLPKVFEYPNPAKSANSHTDLRLSVFLVVEQHKSSGRVLNSDLIVIASSPGVLPPKVGAMLATSSTQHFAKFSLN